MLVADAMPGGFSPGHGLLKLYSRNSPGSAGKEMWNIVNLHSSPQGIIAVSANGKVWIIKKKDANAPAEPANQSAPK
jgi:exosome complex RNA-binding protein Rrp4